MVNQTFTYKDGTRPGAIARAENAAIKNQMAAFVADFNAKNKRHPTETEIARALKITNQKAASILYRLRQIGAVEKRGRIDKPKERDIHDGQLRYVVCSMCYERTCARAAHSETLRGWTQVDVDLGCGVCHKCSKAVAK